MNSPSTRSLSRRVWNSSHMMAWCSSMSTFSHLVFNCKEVSASMWAALRQKNSHRSVYYHASTGSLYPPLPVTSPLPSSYSPKQSWNQQMQKIRHGNRCRWLQGIASGNVFCKYRDFVVGHQPRQDQERLNFQVSQAIYWRDTKTLAITVNDLFKKTRVDFLAVTLLLDLP